MAILIIALYFGISGLYALGSHFSSMGIPQSFGEVFNSTVLTALLKVAVSFGFFKKQIWSRQAALGITGFGFVKTVLSFALNPSQAIVGLYLLSPLFTFLTGFGFGSQIALVLLGVGVTFGWSVFVFYNLFKRSGVDHFLIFETLPESTFTDRLKEAKDYFIVLWILTVWGLSSFQSLVPTSFYRSKDSKDMKVLFEEVKKTPGYQQMEAQKKQQYDASLGLNILFASDEKSVFLQTTSEDRFETSKFYKYDLTTFKLEEILLPKGFTLKNASSDGRYLVHSDREQLLELETKNILKLNQTIGVINADPNSGFVSLGFGPSPGSYLKYQMATKSLSLFNLQTGEVTQTQSLEMDHPSQLRAFWSFDRSQLLLQNSTTKLTWLVKLSPFQVIPVNDLPTLQDEVLIDSNNEGFVSMKKYPQPIDQLSFLWRFDDSSVQQFASVGRPLGLSIQKNYLVFEESGSLKLKPFQGASEIQTLKEGVSSQVTWSPARHYIYFRNDTTGLLEFFDLASPKQGSVGQVGLSSRLGEILVSPSGNLIAMSSGRDLQVFWFSELSKEKPRFAFIKVPKSN